MCEFVVLAECSIPLVLLVSQLTKRFDIGANPKCALFEVGPGSIERLRNRQDIDSASGRNAVEHVVVHGQDMTEHAPVVIQSPRLGLQEVGQSIEDEPRAAQKHPLQRRGSRLVAGLCSGRPKDGDLVLRPSVSLRASLGERFAGEAWASSGFDHSSLGTWGRSSEDRRARRAAADPIP